MIGILLFLSMAHAGTWSMADVQKMMRDPAVVNSDHYLSSLCEAQLEQHRVPTACYQEARNNKSLLRFLNERCNQWIGAEKNLAVLKSWSEHPAVHGSCLDKVRERVSELEYVQEESNPLEYFRAQKAQLARNLKPEPLWKTRLSPKQ